MTMKCVKHCGCPGTHFYLSSFDLEEINKYGETTFNDIYIGYVNFFDILM